MNTLIKLDSVLEIKNKCNGRTVKSPYITQHHLTAYINSVFDGTWKITKKLNLK